MPYVSIIIPIYNAEKYLKQCIESLLNQTYPYFELICIDDGSTDKSYDILMQYKGKDDRILLIKQKNEYAGAARNRGLKAAKKKYVLFLDADDFFCKDMLEKAVKQAEENETEILVFDAYRFDNVEQKVNQGNWKPLNANKFGNGVKSAAEIADSIFEFTVPSPWNKLYLREFVLKNNLYFQNIQRTNDLFFVYAAFACAKRIGILEHKLMYYRDNNEQSLQGGNSRTPDIFVQALFKLQSFLKTRDEREMYIKSFERMALSICVYHLNKLLEKQEYCQLYEVLKCNVVPQICVQTGFSMIKPIIDSKNGLIVYGAGTLAASFIKFLLYKAEYSMDKILIVVSDLRNNVHEICGIEVKPIVSVSSRYKQNCVIIAVSDEKIQSNIEGMIHDNGFVKTARLGFYEFANLVLKFE